MVEISRQSGRSTELLDTLSDNILLTFEQQLRRALLENNPTDLAELHATIRAALALGIAGRVLTLMDMFGTSSDKGVNGCAGTISYYSGPQKDGKQLLFRELRSNILEEVADSTTSPLYGAA